MSLQRQAIATADAAGVAVATFPQVPFGQTWRIAYTTVASTSALRTSATLYRTVRTAANVLDRSRFSGNSDTTDTQLVLNAGDALVVEWTGATPGAVCTATINGDAY